jgi:7,8-dihydropterin-6-yl-methyl-4-(beta-D-ribofuranosyl)aminobenzene 5'-phosphate synthase
MDKMVVLVTLAVLISGLIVGVAIYLRCDEGERGQVMQTKENISTTALKNLSMTVVYDNNPYKEELTTAWGFSCLIRGAEKTILFDTGGDGSIVLSNMEKLGINPAQIDLIVLSHIHGDHVGGLESILEKNSAIIVYLPASFPKSFKDNVERYGAKVVEIKEPLEICQGIYSTGELGTWIKEQSLVIHTERGLIVITGCAHPGIVKIVSKAKDLFKNEILMVMGGFHLGGVSTDEIEKIILSCRKLGVQYVGPCHCSGNTARDLFKKEYGKNFVDIGVGRIIAMDDLK